MNQDIKLKATVSADIGAVVVLPPPLTAITAATTVH
jgi:hypothetical protein